MHTRPPRTARDWLRDAASRFRWLDSHNEAGEFEITELTRRVCRGTWLLRYSRDKSFQFTCDRVGIAAGNKTPEPIKVGIDKLASEIDATLSIHAGNSVLRDERRELDHAIVGSFAITHGVSGFTYALLEQRGMQHLPLELNAARLEGFFHFDQRKCVRVSGYQQFGDFFGVELRQRVHVHIDVDSLEMKRWESQSKAGTRTILVFHKNTSKPCR
jgi:hypothetical protein